MATDRLGRIIWLCGGGEHFLHAGDNLRIGLPGNDPISDLSIRHTVFLASTAPSHG